MDYYTTPFCMLMLQSLREWNFKNIFRKNCFYQTHSEKPGMFTGMNSNGCRIHLFVITKTNQIMTRFHLMRTQTHKMLSIVVLKMSKYTIISLILTDFLANFSAYEPAW